MRKLNLIIPDLYGNKCLRFIFLLVVLLFSNTISKCQCTDISFGLSITPSSCSSTCEFDVRITNHNIEGGMWLYSVDWVKISSQGGETAIVDSGPSDGITFSDIQLIPNGEIEKGILKITLGVFTKIGARIVKKDINGQIICTTVRSAIDANAPSAPPPPAPVLQANPVKVCQKTFIEETATFNVTSPSGYAFKWYEYGSSTQIGSTPDLKYSLGGNGSSLTLNLHYFYIPEDFTTENGKLTKKFSVCTTGGGCTTAVFILEPPPVISTFSDLTICESGGSIVLSDATPSGGTWEGWGIQNGSTFNPSVTGPGQHSVTYNYTDPVTGCSSSKSRIITVEGGVNAGPDIAICNEIMMVELTGATPAGGVWSGPGISGNIFRKRSDIGSPPYNITYTYTFPSGCTISDSRAIQVDTGLPGLVTPNITGESPVCIGTSTTLSANNPNSGFGTPETVYVYWFSGGDYLFKKKSPYDEDRSLSIENLSSTTSYHVQFVWKNVNQTQICGSPLVSKTVAVVQPPSTPVLEVATIHSCPSDVNMGRNVFFKVANASGLTYRWYERNSDGAIIKEITGLETGDPYSFSGVGNSILNIQINRLPNVIYPVQGTTLYKRYSVVAESASQCYSDASSMGYLNLVASPQVSAGEDLSSCINSSPIILEGIPTGGVWTGLGVQDETTFNPMVNGVGQSQLTYVYEDTETGCQSNDTKLITVNAIPTEPIVSDIEVSYNKPALLTASGANNFEYFKWYSSNNTYLAQGETYQTNKIASETYFLVGKYNTETTCESNSTQLTVGVIYNNYNYIWEDIIKRPGIKDLELVGGFRRTKRNHLFVILMALDVQCKL